MTVRVLPEQWVRVDERSDGQHVEVQGRLDVHSAADVRLLLRDAVDDGSGPVLLHLGRAEIGDATGLGLLVECHRRSRRRGRVVRLVDATARSRRLLRRARLERAFGLAADVVTLTA